METKGQSDYYISRFKDSWSSPLPYFEIKTSGSTGKPKIIRLSKDLMKESALRTINFFGITHNSLLYNCVSAQFIGGLMMQVRSEISGATIINEPASNRPKINSNKTIKLLSVVPSQMLHIISEKRNYDNIPEIENILIGGSPINHYLRNEISELGIDAWESYGMTETASHIALRKVGCNEKPFSLLPGIKIDIDKRNCLVIQLKGEASIITNDVAEILNEKEFYIKGRYDNVIISGGKKIFPEEVERAISNKYNYRFIVTSRAHIKWGEELIVISDDKEMERRQEEIKRYLKEILPSESIPKEIITIKEMPVNEMGKIKRFELKSF